MKYLSKEAKLSTLQYTNHSIRATVITTLDKCGFEARHITAISGHKNESTMKTYSVQCPDVKKKEMHKALSTKLLPKNTVKKEIAETVSRNPENTLATINMNDLAAIRSNNENTTENQQNKEQNQQQNQQEPNFQLANFDPEEDKFLMDYLNKFPNLLDNPTENAPQVVPQGNQTMQTTMNSTSNTMPVMPKMFFANSNVTINYHIHPK